MHCTVIPCNSPITLGSNYSWYISVVCPPSRLIRMSSPNLNYLIGGGAIILYMNTYFFIVPTTDPQAVTVLCNLTPWLTALGYSFCYGTILAKMVRVYYIFDKPTPQKRKVGFKKLIKIRRFASSAEDQKCHHEL